MIKWNYILITALLLGGSWLVFEIDKLDEEYNRLLNEGIHELKIIEHMSYNSNRRHNLFYSMMRETDSTRFNNLVSEWKNLKTINSNFFDTIMSLNQSAASQQQLILAAQGVRKEYNDYCDKQLASHFSDLSSSDSKDLIKFDQLFEDYQEKVNDLFLSKHRIMKSSSEDLATRVESKIRNILLFLFSPVVAALCFVAFAFVAFRFFYSKGKTYY